MTQSVAYMTGIFRLEIVVSEVGLCLHATACQWICLCLSFVSMSMSSHVMLLTTGLAINTSHPTN